MLSFIISFIIVSFIMLSLIICFIIISLNILSSDGSPLVVPHVNDIGRKQCYQDTQTSFNYLSLVINSITIDNILLFQESKKWWAVVFYATTSLPIYQHHTPPAGLSLSANRRRMMFSNNVFCSIWGIIWEFVPYYTAFLVFSLSTLRTFALLKPFVRYFRPLTNSLFSRL